MKENKKIKYVVKKYIIVKKRPVKIYKIQS